MRGCKQRHRWGRWAFRHSTHSGLSGYCSFSPQGIWKTWSYSFGAGNRSYTSYSSFITLFFSFKRERVSARVPERETETETETETEWERQSKAGHTLHRVGCRARSHIPGTMIWAEIKSWTLNRLNHPNAPILPFYMSLKMVRRRQKCYFNNLPLRGTWLAQVVKHATLDLRLWTELHTGPRAYLKEIKNNFPLWALLSFLYNF